MRQTITLTLVLSLIICGGYIYIEPELARAATSTATTGVSLTVTGEINLNCSSTVILLPDMAGQTGGTATGTFGCVVTTSNTTGYNMTIKKDQKLMITDVADQRFDDYATSTAYSDWTFAAPGDGNERFGFSIVACASTTDIVQNFRDDGSANCATSTSVTGWHCWAPIPTTPTTEAVANRTTATPGVGILTTFGLQAQAGGSNNLNSGSYTCTTTVTAATNP